MVRSMTAFAREQRLGDWGTVAWELRSVNFRYLDVAVRLPEELRSLEPAVRERVGARLGRGKVECSLRLQPSPTHGGHLSLNAELAEQLAAACREVDSLFGQPSPVNTVDFLRWPGILQPAKLDTERVGKEVIELLDGALEDLVAAREREGAKLGQLIEDRCRDMGTIVKTVRQRLPQILDAQRERIRARLMEIRDELDETRLEQEMVLIAQKADVAEELDRLEGHIEEVGRNLSQNKPVGRKLDFLMQELNREANTLGSKSIDRDTTSASVELKVLIEQAREQVQNIE